MESPVSGDAEGARDLISARSVVSSGRPKNSVNVADTGWHQSQSGRYQLNTGEQRAGGDYEGSYNVYRLQNRDGVPSPMTATFQTTKNMFSAYLNQDFDLVFGTADDAIRAFMQHSAQDEVSQAMHDVRAILSMKLSEKDLQKLILQDLGSCYYYPTEWASAELWLKHVLELLGS